MNSTLYATPEMVTDLSSCAFYHSTNLPGYGEIEGEWDLRGNVDKYLGNVTFNGKRCLEIGSADGFLSFEIEKRGAEIVCFDLSPQLSLDVIPFARGDITAARAQAAETIGGMNNAFWLSHRLFESQAKMVYGHAYNVPESIGSVEITTFGSILMHLRDPFLALSSACRLTTETIIVTDALNPIHMPAALRSLRNRLPAELRRPAMRFRADWRNRDWLSQQAQWWVMLPELVQEFLGVLGFEKTTISYHSQEFPGASRGSGLSKRTRRAMYTVVAKRTVPLEPA